MNTPDPKTAWDAYCRDELALLRPLLGEHGITLDSEQKHMQGERYLQQAVTTASGRKLILTGTMHEAGAVIIKATRDGAGAREIDHERTCREVLKRIDFAGSTFHTPEELLYLHANGFTVTVQRFIPQELSFLDRPLREQCALALRAFKAQESAHATTSRHRAFITRTFPMRTKSAYLETFRSFIANITFAYPEHAALTPLLERALTVLNANEKTIEQYCGFLTHTDFVPHNIRVHQDTIYLLDHSSLTFGNKYEGWARFLNFMVLYNGELERLLVEYVQQNRTPEESVSLRMMRIYRLGEIIWYYVQTLDKSSGNLHALNSARIAFWSTVLTHTLEDTPVPQHVIDDYKNVRDSLRSEDEKNRQQGLH